MSRWARENPEFEGDRRDFIEGAAWGGEPAAPALPCFEICVNAAGCLPDSESYPYVVVGYDAVYDALVDEIAEQADMDEQRGDPVPGTAEGMVQALRDDGAVQFPLPGTYTLSVVQR